MQHWTWYLLEILRRPGFPSCTQTRLVPNSCVRKSTRTKLQKSSMTSILKVIVHLATSLKRIPFGKLLIQAISVAPVDVFKQNFNFVKSCFHILWLCFVLCPVRKSFSCTMPSSLCTMGRKTCAIMWKRLNCICFDSLAHACYDVMTLLSLSKSPSFVMLLGIDGQFFRLFYSKSF